MERKWRGPTLYALKGVYSVLTLATAVLVSRQFGAEGFGEYSLLTTAIAMSVPIASLGSRHAMIEAASRLKVADMRIFAGELLAVIAVVSSLVAGLVGLLLWALGSATWRLSWAVIPACLLAALVGYLHGLERQVTSSTIESFARPVLAFGGIAIGIALGSKFTTALGIAIGGGYALTALLAVLALRKRLTLVSPTLHPLREASLRVRLIAFSLIALLTSIMAQVDRFFLAAYTDAATLGPYAAAQNLQNLVVYGSSVATALLLPVFAAGMAGRTPRAVMLRRAKQFARIVLLMAIGALIVVVFFGGRLLSVFGVGFESAHSALIILMAGLTISLVFGFPTSALSMSNHRGSVVWTMGSAALIVALLCVVLIPKYGVVGAAIANSVGIVCSRLFGHLVLLRRTGYSVAAY